MNITRLESFPAGENPFWHDGFHMGHYLGENVVAMFGKFEKEHQPYIILIDITSGERVQIDFAAAKVEP